MSNIEIKKCVVVAIHPNGNKPPKVTVLVDGVKASYLINKTHINFAQPTSFTKVLVDSIKNEKEIEVQIKPSNHKGYTNLWLNPNTTNDKFDVDAFAKLHGIA